MARACGVLFGPWKRNRADRMAFLREAWRQFPDTSCLLDGRHGAGTRHSVMPDVNHGRDNEDRLRLPPQTTIAP
jgi:hypothetical protein